MCRLFSVVRYESVIHEFDPWFNFRTTKYLIEAGFYEFHNWFDDATWSVARDRNVVVLLVQFVDTGRRVSPCALHSIL